MMKIIGRIAGAIVLLGLGFYIRGFMSAGGPPMGMMGMEMPPPAVVAVALEEQPLDVLDEYIASIEPVQEVMIKTEVSGYIDAVHFREGAFVEEGEILFTIDRRQYEAMVAVREAELGSARAELKRADQFLERLKQADTRSISASDLETAESAQLQAAAALKQAEANLNLARIDLSYSEIRAPISGRIGAALLTKGNYVDAMLGNTLARIIQTDPIRVVFSMTDRAYLNLLQQEHEGKADKQVARIRLPNGIVLPLIGRKDFADNEMNADTGTMAVRYLFENGGGMLVPGSYARILLGTEERPMGIRVPQQAILQDAQGSYVLTVNDEGLVGAARIEAGSSIETDRVVLTGLKPGDRVVVEGVQKAQPGMTATVTLMEAGK